MLLEVISREITSIFNQTYLFLHFLEGKGIIYHLIAYDLKIEENVRNLCFLKFKVVFRKILKYPKNVWPFFIYSYCKNRTFYTQYFMKVCTFRGINCRYRRSRSKSIKHRRLLNFPQNFHIFIHNNWNITRYKTVSVATQILVRICLIAS